MSLRIIQPPSDIFAGGAQAIVVPTNCLGTCGKGLALAAKRLWPDWAADYREACADGLVGPGDVWAAELDLAPPHPRWVVALATKDHWRDGSRLEWVMTGVRELAEWCREEMPASVAVPALGCGTGGLAWGPVQQAIVDILGDVPGVEFKVYAPHEQVRTKPSATANGAT